MLSAAMSNDSRLSPSSAALSRQPSSSQHHGLRGQNVSRSPSRNAMSSNRLNAWGGRLDVLASVAVPDHQISHMANDMSFSQELSSIGTSGDSFLSNVAGDNPPHPEINQQSMQSIVSMVLSRLQKTKKNESISHSTHSKSPSPSRLSPASAGERARSNSVRSQSSAMEAGSPSNTISISQDDIVKSIASAVAEIVNKPDDPKDRICEECGKRLKRNCDMK